jgi:hypothetical protein
MLSSTCHRIVAQDIIRLWPQVGEKEDESSLALHVVLLISWHILVRII